MKKVDVKDHWREELTKLRCWITGFNAGRTPPGSLSNNLPGEDVLRQIIQAIDNAKDEKSVGRKSKI